MTVLSVLFAAVAFATTWSLVYAQTSDAKCSPEFKWAENSRGQSPCIVASFLRAACEGGNYNINALREGSYYIGPSDPIYSDTCRCSSVTYSLMAACQVCQGRAPGLIDWSEWTTNCTKTDISNGYFPAEKIPLGTAIPAWALANTYIPGQTFSSVEAQNYATTNKHEATQSSMQPSSSAPNSSISFPARSSLSPSASATSQSVDGNQSSGSSNTGVIAGGVVGGLAGLAIIGAVVFFLRRKKQSLQSLPLAPGSQTPMTQPGYQQSPFTPTPGHGRSGSDSASTRYYNPSDPSTFPSQFTSPLLYNQSPPPSSPFQPSQTPRRPNLPEI